MGESKSCKAENKVATVITINDKSLVGLMFGKSAKESVWWMKFW